MSGILKMPRMGETMDEGKLLAWLVEPGQAFKRGDPILEVETDKTVVEFPALGDGTLVQSLVELGEMVDVGTPIAEIDVGEGPDWTGTDEDASYEDAGSAIVDAKADAPPAHQTPQNPTVSPRPTGEKIRATPLARRAAQQAGIDIAQLLGTGRRGRVEHRDVIAANQTAPTGHTQGHGIAWVEKGERSGTPVVLLHGFAADYSAWSGLQSQLARAGHRTFAVDLPGHGAANAEATCTTALAPPLIAMAEEQFGWAPIHIVAHSMGTIAAVALAKARPTASLTLIAPAGIGRTIDANFLDELSEPRDLNSVKQALERLTHGSNGLSDAAYQAIFKTLQRRRLGGLVTSLAGASGQAVDIRNDLSALAKEITVSILLGHRDQIVNWSETLDVSPHIQTHHFANVGHMPHWEALPDVTSIVERKINL